jgi:hypothetical protein
MDIKLKLDTKKYVSLPEILVAGQKAVIAFESKEYEFGILCVIVDNGVMSETFVLENDYTIDITKFIDRGCKLDIAIEHIIKGRTVKRWRIEPIVVREIDPDIEPIPQIVDFERRLARMENIIIEFNQKLNDSL